MCGGQWSSRRRPSATRRCICPIPAPRRTSPAPPRPLRTTTTTTTQSAETWSAPTHARARCTSPSAAVRRSTSPCTGSAEVPAKVRVVRGRTRVGANRPRRRRSAVSGSARRTCSLARGSAVRERRCVRPANSALGICTSRVAGSSRFTSALSSVVPQPATRRRPQHVPGDSSSS